MYILAAFMAGAIVVPWVFLVLTPIVLVLGSGVLVLSGVLALFGRDLTIQTGDILKLNKLGTKSRLLIVDDDYPSILPLIGMLEGANAQVQFVSSGKEMIEELRSSAYDVVFLDSRMPHMSGEVALEMGDQILHLEKKQPVIFVSGDVNRINLPWNLKQFDIRDAWRKGDIGELQKNVDDLLLPPPEYVA